MNRESLVEAIQAAWAKEATPEQHALIDRWVEDRVMNASGEDVIRLLVELLFDVRTQNRPGHVKKPYRRRKRRA